MEWFIMADDWFTNIATNAFLPHLTINLIVKSGQNAFVVMLVNQLLVYVLLWDHKLGDEMRCQGTFRTTNMFGDQ